MIKKGKANYIIAIVIIAAIALSFRPGMWLVHKPASSQNEFYVKGWEHGCISGTNSYSLLYAPLMDKPFIKDIETPAKLDDKTATIVKDQYKTGWNEGFTLCRFYQSSVYELMQFSIVVVTLLFIGYMLARRKND